jgi:2-methylcitrate dehydratase PrpD
VAASLASGLQANFGTMTKPLHAGWAAHNGVVAARLAGRGFEAAGQAVEGFLRAMSGGAAHDPGAVLRGLGDPWEVVDPGVGVKLYPCCYAIARAADAAISLHAAIQSPIDGVHVTVTPGTLLPLIKGAPSTPLEAKFSLEYCVAAGLLDGRLDPASFTEQAVRRPDIRRVMERITVAEEGPARDFPIDGRAELRVRAGGAELVRAVETPRGDPRNPLSWEDLLGKFFDCAAPVVGEGLARRIAEAVAGFEDAAVGELTALLAGGGDA